MPTDLRDHDNAFKAHFEDPEKVANHTDGPRRFVPGLEALHLMTGLLLAERAPEDARILVLGAGGAWKSRRWPRPTRAGPLLASTRRRKCCGWPNG